MQYLNVCLPTFSFIVNESTQLWVLSLDHSLGMSDMKNIRV